MASIALGVLGCLGAMLARRALAADPLVLLRDE
jgi:hypothetical protein